MIVVAMYAWGVALEEVLTTRITVVAKENYGVGVDSNACGVTAFGVFSFNMDRCTDRDYRY